MGRWIKNLLGLVISVFLLWYLYRHWDQLRSLLRINVSRLAILFGLYFATTICCAALVQLLVGVLKNKPAFWEMVWLHNAAALLNYIPGKFGTIFRANYLKRHYGLGFTRFVVLFLYMSLLTSAIATAGGTVALLTVYGLGDYQTKILGGVLVAITAGAILLLFVPLPAPAGKNRFSEILREFIVGRRELAKNQKNNSFAGLLLTINLILSAAITRLIYNSIDTPVHPAGCFILGSLGYVVLLLGITPGGLGIRELVLSFGAKVLGIPIEVGLLAAMLDRAVGLVYTFIVGGVCAAWLWHRSPTDFKKANGNSPPEH